MSIRERECKLSIRDDMKLLSSEYIRNVYFQEEDPDKIWESVICESEHDKKVFAEICKTFKKMAFDGVKGEVTEWLAHLMYKRAYQQTGYFVKESDWLSKQSNGVLSRSKMAFIQRAYTWAHFGCSTVCIWDEHAQENVCMRSLDWQGARVLGDATRVFNFTSRTEGSENHFMTVGTIGMLGVLTGMKEEFSIVINYAPWFKTSADYDVDPTFKVRELLENPAIVTFDDAVNAINEGKVSSPVFLTICGKDKDKACVVEIGADDKKNIRNSQNGLLIQTNYFDPEGSFGWLEKERMPFRSQQKPYPVDEKGKSLIKDGAHITDTDWYSGKLIPHSAIRHEMLKKALVGFSGTSEKLENLLIRIYKKPPIWNWETAYWTLMRPGSGSMRVWARNVRS